MNSKKSLFDTNNYLTIEALENGLVVLFERSSVHIDGDIQYSVDGGNWASFSANTTLPPINRGQLISFRAELTPSRFGIGIFRVSKKFNLKGDCKSLLYGDEAANNHSLSQYAFFQLFYNCNSLVSCDRTVLSATTLASYCYQYIFQGCTSLVDAPELPATTLAVSCYDSMFYGCSKLNYIKMLATDISARDCLYNWVYGVASSGTFVKNKNATWNVTGASGVPSGWTIQKV